MKRGTLLHWVTSVLLSLAVLGALQADHSSFARAQKTPQAGQKAVHGAKMSEGQRKFEENCSRCHNAPQSFPPSIAGTIVRHMRVRASLSEQDAWDILHFLNP